MPQTPDIEELAAQDNALAEEQAAAAMPAAAAIRVIDGSTQLTKGYVSGELEGRSVRVIVPAYLDYRSAQPTSGGQVVYAIPLNGKIDTSEYLAVAPVWNGSDSSRAPRLMATQVQIVNADGSSSASVTTDHGNLTGLGDDDHTQYHNDARGDARYYTQAQLNAGQLNTLYYTESEIDTTLAGYALLAGRAGGQTLNGGTGSGDDLTLISTSHGTKGSIYFGAAGALGEITSAGQFLLPVTGSAGGLLVGGDAALYRGAADRWQTPDSFQIDSNLAVGSTPVTTTRLLLDQTLTDPASSARALDATFTLTLTTNSSVAHQAIRSNVTTNVASGVAGGTITPYQNRHTVAATNAGSVNVNINHVLGSLLSGAAGSISLLRGLFVQAVTSSGPVTTAYTNLRAIEIGAINATELDGATVTNARGIRILDINGASSSNASIETNAGNVIFNEGGDANTDFRVEGDTDANLFFTDASVDMVGIGTNAPAIKLDVNSDSIRIRTAKTPATAGAAGVQGQIAWDSDFLYIATGTNTWKRVAIATW